MRLTTTNNLTLLSVLLFSLLIASCSGTTKQYMSPDIEADDNATVSLLIIDRDTFQSVQADHTFGELRLNEEPMFNNDLINLLRGVTDANVQDQLQSYDLDQSIFSVQNFTEGGTNLNIMAPENGTELISNGETPRFVLLLDGFRFDTYEDLVGGDSYAGHEPDVVPRITFETNYLIWDNNVREAVAWGTIDSDKRIELARIEEIYEELIIDSLQRMTRMSPLPPRRS